MDINYLKDKPEVTILVWGWMERMQEEYPHLQFGWNGFIPMVIHH